MAEDTKIPESAKVTNDKLGESGSNNMHVRIYAPYKVYYDGNAESVSAINDTGPFDILPRHHNFMTLLNAGDVVVRNGDEQEKVTIQRGVMHVKADEVIVFLDV